MTPDDWQTIGVIVAVVLSAVGVAEKAVGIFDRVFKIPVDRRFQNTDTRRIEADIIQKYQDKYDAAMDRLSTLEAQRTADNGANDIKFNALRSEVEIQTKRADTYQRQAETVAAENVKLTQEVTSIRSLMRRILEWGKKWEPELKAAGIEPMPME